MWRWLMAGEVWWLPQTQAVLVSSGLGEEESAWEWSGLWDCLPGWELAGECRGNIQTKPSCHNQLSRHTLATQPPPIMSSVDITRTFPQILLPSSSPSPQKHLRQKNRPRAPVKIRGEAGVWLRGGERGGGMVDNDCLHDQLRNYLIWHSRRLSTQVPGIYYLIIYEWELWELRPVTVTVVCRTFIALYWLDAASWYQTEYC